MTRRAMPNVTGWAVFGLLLAGTGGPGGGATTVPGSKGEATA